MLLIFDVIAMFCWKYNLCNILNTQIINLTLQKLARKLMIQLEQKHNNVADQIISF